MYLFEIIIFSFFTGIIGTGIGGLIAFIYKKPTDKLISTTLGFASGLMLAVVCFDLLPHAFDTGGLINGILGMVIGVLLVTYFDMKVGEVLPDRSNARGVDYIKMGILMGMAIAVHNFPEGLAIGTGFSTSPEMGMGLMLVIGLHDVPEGIAMAAPMSIGGLNKYKAFLYTLLSGVPTGIAALIGLYIGKISPAVISQSMGFAGGAMLYVTCGEMIPRSRSIYVGRISIFGMIFGVIGGIIITRILR
uniref:ZIP family metal transporter n=1 Tax=Caldanaerobius polysaccharolyticus TaxID=44256 RepID=UPI000689C611